MSYNQALRQVICDELNRQAARYTSYDDAPVPTIKPADILGIDCTWDDGSNCDPTYPSSPTPPTFEFSVRLRATKATRPLPTTVSVSFLMGALLNTILETGL